jgi:hypothetical protein
MTGCSTVTHVFHPQPISIPAAHFQCENPTERPVGSPIMESQVAKYIASLEKTVPDCKYRLKEIQIIIDCFNDKKCDPNSLMKGLEVADQRPKR